MSVPFAPRKDPQPMDIVIDSLLAGAARAAGTVAIIDVFRAFTTAAVALANGARRILMVGSVAEALALRAAGLGEICLGEVHGQTPPGFDFGNSPHEIAAADLRGRTLIQRTSAGTQGVLAAHGAGRLYAAALVTAEATARAMRAGAPQRITLVAMGEEGSVRTEEDEACALYLRDRLEGRPGDAEAVRRRILAGREIARFHDPARPYLHPADIAIALDIDRYDFAVRVDLLEGRPVARIEQPPRG
jgi:2-phosphosulfolactate phosphatase